MMTKLTKYILSYMYVIVQKSKEKLPNSKEIISDKWFESSEEIFRGS